MAAAAESLPDRGLLVQALRLHQAGRLQEAEDTYARYLAAHPDVPTALNNAATLALAMGRAPLAVARLERAVAIDPDGTVGRHNLGFALIRAGRPRDAMFHLESAVARDPGYTSAWNNLGIALAHAGNRPEAIRAFERALSLDAGFADAAVNLGDMHNRSGDPARARAAFERALAARPDHPGAIVGVSFAQALEGELDPALAAMEARARPAPAYAPFWQTLAALRHWSGDLDRAEDAYKQASALDPTDFDAKFGIASTLLGRGDYPRGLRAFEERPDGRYGPARRFPALPVWGGAKTDGTLLVFCEQGLGDVVQFARFVPAARERAGGLVFVVDGYWRTLAPLLASLAGVDHLLPDAVAVEALERPPAARTSVLSLAYLLDVVPERLPGPVPYLAAPDDRVQTWAPRVAALPGLKVGLAWSALHRGDHGYLTRHKSVPVAALAPIVAQPGASFVSLQPGAAGDRTPLGALADRIVDWTGEIRDFGDTAAIIAALDLVVTTDTAVAHVAGALGKPVWLLDRYNACWRWRLHPERSPWYPTLSIFRQHAFLDWTGPLAAVEAELARVIAGARALP
jgi:tetratricopeptide (TPR) repeat protein